MIYFICSISIADVTILVYQLFLSSFRVESKGTARNVLRTSQMLHLSLAHINNCHDNSCKYTIAHCITDNT